MILEKFIKKSKQKSNFNKLKYLKKSVKFCKKSSKIPDLVTIPNWFQKRSRELSRCLKKKTVYGIFTIFRRKLQKNFKYSKKIYKTVLENYIIITIQIKNKYSRKFKSTLKKSFKILEKNLIKFLKNSLKNFYKVLNKFLRN